MIFRRQHAINDASLEVISEDGVLLDLCYNLIKEIPVEYLRVLFNFKKQDSTFEKFINSISVYEVSVSINTPKRVLTIKKILEVVCEAMQITQDFIQIKSNRRECVYPRQLYYYFACNYSTAGLKNIGELVGFDHATVIHGRRQILNILNSPGSQLIKDEIFSIEDKLVKLSRG